MDLVFLHGPAAAGKLTIGRAVSDLVGHPVFHNHLVVDLLTTVFPFGTPAFVELRERFWFDVIAAAAREQRSLVFTFAPEATVPSGFPDRLRATVEDAGGRLCSVGLRVGAAEQERRLMNPRRTEFRKLTDVDLLRRGRTTERGEQPPADLEIDTEAMSPIAAAGLIVSHFGLTPQPGLPRYPSRG